MAFIRITLKSDMCAGSGEATGVTVDTDISMAPSGLPYIPARRIKGCLRQSAELLQKYDRSIGADLLEALFGNSTGVEGCLVLRDAKLKDSNAMERWLKSGVPAVLQQAAIPLNVAKQFTYIRGQTRLQDGVADDGSLRYTRVLQHYNALDHSQETVLEAPVSFRKTEELTENNIQTLADFLENCCRATRHMGTMRNRGLGHVKVELVGKDDLTAASQEKQPERSDPQTEAGGEKEIQYRIRLDAPVTLPGCSEDLLEIPARSVIGCLAGTYLRTGNAADKAFKDLFLNGTVRWSSLTPAADGVRTIPTPLMLVHMKNEGTYKNRFAAAEKELKGKQKTLDGTFSAPVDSGFSITKIKSHTLYHHSTKGEGTLYMQSSLDPGMIYGGSVIAPAQMEALILSLLKNTSFAFGRSRSAQYAACSLVGEPAAHDRTNPERDVDGEVYVVLTADMVLSGEDGTYIIDPDQVRKKLAAELPVENELPPERQDYCQYHTISGYHAQWQLQKPQVPAVRGGSVYCFKATDGKIPTWLTIGEYQQEGMGLCRIYTETEMKALATVTRTNTDTDQIPGSDPGNNMENALLLYADRERFRQQIQKYVYEMNQIRRGIAGRLRLMLAEAKDYKDFLDKIRSIKESDKSSENKTSDGEKAEKLVKSIYGDETTPSFEKLLSDENPKHDLWRLTESNTDVLDRLRNELWKEPLQMLLHLAYYNDAGKEDRR